MDSTEWHSGRFSLRIAGDLTAEQTHSLGYWIEPWALYGKKLTLKGWFKTDNPAGKAGVSLGAYGAMGPVDFAATPEEDFAGATEWTPWSLTISADTSAYTILIVLEKSGPGTVWFDGFSLWADDRLLNEVQVAPAFSDREFKQLRKNTRALTRVKPAARTEKDDFKDLDAFRRIAGDAPIIALGESTHGTGEFFEVKHRLLTCAVREMGITVFALEANQVEVERINRYVSDGTGAPEEAVKSLFAVWQTREMLDLMRWLRAWNEQHPDRKVEFVGFDMQDPSLPVDSLLAFLSARDPALLAEVEPLVRDYRQAWKNQPYPWAPDSIRLIWKTNAEQAWALVNGKQRQWADMAGTNTEKEKTGSAIQYARLIAQAAKSAFSQDFRDRDSAMAENVAWLLETRPPGTRMLVWAHDAHINRGGHPNPSLNYYSGGAMGAFLAKKYGDRYRAFGLSTYDGAYSATISFSNHKMTDVEAFPSPLGSYDEALHRLFAQKGGAGLLLDLRPFRREGKKYGPFLAPRPVRFIGYAASDYGYGARFSIPWQFDGLIFIDRTRASRRLKQSE